MSDTTSWICEGNPFLHLFSFQPFSSFLMCSVFTHPFFPLYLALEFPRALAVLCPPFLVQCFVCVCFLFPQLSRDCERKRKWKQAFSLNLQGAAKAARRRIETHESLCSVFILALCHVLNCVLEPMATAANSSKHWLCSNVKPSTIRRVFQVSIAWPGYRT